MRAGRAEKSRSAKERAAERSDVEAQDRLVRIEGLMTQMAAELDSIREEARIVSESLAAASEATAARAQRARLESRAAGRRAEDREKATQRLIRQKRR